MGLGGMDVGMDEDVAVAVVGGGGREVGTEEGGAICLYVVASS